MIRIAPKNYWAEHFLKLLQSQNFCCQPVKYINGWLETAKINENICFMKSFTYNLSTKQYFQGIDPNKVNSEIDFIVFCGGVNDTLRDIFIIPWNKFHTNLERAEPINTYQNRKYMQYKFKIRERDNCWICSFQGGIRPELDITYFHINTNFEKIKFLLASNNDGINFNYGKDY